MNIPELHYDLPQSQSNLIKEDKLNIFWMTNKSARNLRITKILKCFKTLMCITYYTGCTPFKLVTSYQEGEVRHYFGITPIQKVDKNLNSLKDNF